MHFRNMFNKHSTPHNLQWNFVFTKLAVLTLSHPHRQQRSPCKNNAEFLLVNAFHLSYLRTSIRIRSLRGVRGIRPQEYKLEELTTNEIGERLRENETCQ